MKRCYLQKKLNYLILLQTLIQTFIKKVRDHCHEIGKYTEPACEMCNLRYKQQKFIPVFFPMAPVMISIYHIVKSLNRIMIKK